MKITCEKCGVVYKINVPDSSKGKTIKTQCPKCKNIQPTLASVSSEIEFDKTGETQLPPIKIDNKDTPPIPPIDSKKSGKMSSFDFDPPSVQSNSNPFLSEALSKSSNSNPFFPNTDKGNPNSISNTINSFNNNSSDDYSMQPVSANISEEFFTNEFTLPAVDIEKIRKDEERSLLNRYTPFETGEIKKSEMFYKAKKGNLFLGPYNIDEMIQAIKAGDVTKEWLFSKGGGEWLPVEKFNELLAYFPSRIEKTKATGDSIPKLIVKYTFVAAFLAGIAFGTVYLLENFSEIKSTIKEVSVGEEKKDPLKEYIKKWSESIILSDRTESDLHISAINDYYDDNEEDYILSVQKFKEVLVKDPTRVDSFFQMIIAISLSTSSIEKKEDLEAYKKILQTMLAKNSSNVLIHNALSALNFKLAQFNESYSEALEGYKIQPANPISHYLLGQIYLKTQAEKAVESFKKSVELEPRFMAANKMLAKSFLQSKDFRGAVSYYENQKSSFSKFVLARVYLEIGFYSRAINTLKYLTKMKDAPIDSFILLGASLYQFEKNYKDALEIFLDLEEKEFFKAKKSDKLDILKHISIIYRLQNNFQKSFDYSTKLLALEPKYPPTLFNMALLYIKQKNYDKADFYINQFKKEVQGLDKESHILTFEYYKTKGDYQEAIDSLNMLISKERYNNVFYLMKAEIAALKKDFDLANATLYELNKIDPDYYVRNYLKLTDYFVGFYEPQDLMKYYDTLIKDPDSEKYIVLNNVGIIYYQLRKYDRALFYFIKALELDDRNFSNYLYLSYLNYNTKKYKNVFNYVDKGIELQDTNPLFYLIAVKAAIKSNDFEKAKKYLTNGQLKAQNSPFINLAEALYLIGTGDDSKATTLLKQLQDIFQYDYYIKNLLFSLKVE
ncbi:tetratricopeptide repeat protein [bacterium]|nr:tetratricopeptide repeat protein [bacterium]